MMFRVFAVFDAKIEAYMQPFVARTSGEALRSWESVCNDPSTQMCKFPGDFTLFEIGEYDEKKGALIPHAAHKSLATALEYKKSESSALRSVQ